MEYIAMKKLSLSSIFVFLLSGLFYNNADAQHVLFKNIQIGGSANFSTLHYESDLSSLNDDISSDAGFQIHITTRHDLSERIGLQTGLEYFYYAYDFSTRTVVTDENGEPTGEILRTRLEDSIQTSYLSLPLRLQFRPVAERPFYISAGTELSYKIGYSDGELVTQRIPAEGDPIDEPELASTYDAPGQANDVLLSGTLGVGYDFGEGFPLTAEIRAKHSITPYLSGENVANSWVRSLAFTLAYRL
jgi:hypothetical protein